MVFTILTIACHKSSPVLHKIGDNQLNKKDIGSAPPPTQPTFTGSIESNVDQWKRLSIGYSMLLNDPSLCNNYDFKIKINNLVASNDESPIRNYVLYNNVSSTNFVFNQPTANNNDLYEALKDRISNMTPPTTINNWDNSFFGSFIYNNTTNLEQYFVTITIPQREFQASNGHWGLSSLVCPDPESFGYPMTAYSYDNSGSGSVKEVLIADNEAFDEIVENGTYMVFTLQFDYEFIDDKEISNGCEGGYTVGDNICDGNCGENTSNSPGDCGDHTKNKVLYLQKVKINEDYKDLKAPWQADRMHWEKAAAGNYEPGFSCWTVNTNGRWTAIKKCQLKKIRHKDVKRTRKRWDRSYVSRGSSIYVQASEKNVNNDIEKVVISNHYNPILSNIYIFFYENDPFKGQKLNSFVPLSIGTAKIDDLIWRGQRGNITASKLQNVTWGLGAFVTPPPNANNYRTEILPNTIEWIPEVILGRNAMAYHYDKDERNHVDFIIYYLIDSREF